MNYYTGGITSHLLTILDTLETLLDPKVIDYTCLHLFIIMTTDTIPKFKPLSNTNYSEWSGEMKAWLMKLGYWRLVSGREIKPTSNKEEQLDRWEMKAERAAGEIFLALEKDQKVYVKGLEEDPVAM